jgi:hypothetical protein
MEQIGRDPVAHARLIVLRRLATTYCQSEPASSAAQERPQPWSDELATMSVVYARWNFGAALLCGLLSLVYVRWCLCAQ